MANNTLVHFAWMLGLDLFCLPTNGFSIKPPTVSTLSRGADFATQTRFRLFGPIAQDLSSSQGTSLSLSEAMCPLG